MEVVGHVVAEPQLAGHPPHEQLERGVGRLEGVALLLAGLDRVGHRRQQRRVRQVEAELAALELDARPAGHLRDEHPHVVAHGGRVDVLVQVGVDADGARVQAGLVGERAGPDVGLARVRRHVGDLADRVRDPGRLGQPARGQHLPAALELEVGQDGDQVGVARPLAVAVERALHLHGAGLDRGQRAGHRAAGVVVAVDAQAGAGGGVHLGDEVGDDVGQVPAVGVAQRRRRRPRRPGRPAAPPGRRPGRAASRRRSARRRGRPRGPRATRKATVSATIARFSAGVVRSAFSTWPTWLLATRVTTGARESSRARTCGSEDASPPARRVEPNAASRAWRRSSSSAARAKNSVSLGIAPGQPPSMTPTPRSSRCRAMASLSTTDSDRPSCWAPSRRVVS